MTLTILFTTFAILCNPMKIKSEIDWKGHFWLVTLSVTRGPFFESSAEANAKKAKIEIFILSRKKE